MSFNRLYFNSIRLLWPAKRAMTDIKKKIFGPTCDVISDDRIKFRSIFGKFKPGAIKFRFRIENWSISLADSRGAERPPPHPHPRRAESGNTPTGRGLKLALTAQAGLQTTDPSPPSPSNWSSNSSSLKPPKPWSRGPPGVSGFAGGCLGR